MKSGESKLIMVCDDQKDIRESVKQILTDEGFQVITAENGEDLLTKLHSHKPNLILLDVIMPGLVTKEILAKMKEKKIHIPIIFLTVVRLAEKSKELVGNGNVVDYIEKPFENKDLVQRVIKGMK